MKLSDIANEDMDKFIKEVLNECRFENRAERNRIKRGLQDDVKIMNSLTPKQMKFMNKVSDQKANMYAEAMINELFMSYHTALHEAGLKYEQILNLENRTRDIIKECNDEIERGEIDMDKKITREMLIEKAKKYGLDKAGRIKIAKELKSTYSTVTTYISRWKITDKDIKSDEEKEVEEAAERILGIIDPENNEKAKEDEENEEELKQNAEKIIETAKEMQCSDKKEVKEEVIMENEEIKGLKIKSMVVEGNNGTYKVCEEGVELRKDGLAMHFQNIEQLDEFMAEFKQVFNMVK